MITKSISMLRYVMAILSFVFLSNTVSAQLENGSILQDNLIGLDIVSGETIDVFELLDENKTIVIHFFTSWSSSSWDFQQSNILQNIDNQFGANATDQLRVISVEIDELTSVDEITNTNGASSTKGDWTADNNFSFVNDESWATIFNESNVPGIYIVRPNRAILNMRSKDIANRLYDEEFWVRALGFAGVSDDIYMLGKLTSSSHCSETNYSTSCGFLNLGLTNLTTASLEMLTNGQNPTSFDFAGDLGVFSTGMAETPSILLDEETEIRVRPTFANGSVVAATFANFIHGSVYFDEIEPSSFIVRVNTDYYPAETSGTVNMDDGTELLSFGPFEAGDEDLWGGGGPDANTSHDFIVDLPWPQVHINCISIRLNDEGGDGFKYWEGENQPGIQLLYLNGDIIKDQYEPKNFGSMLETEIGASVSSSLENVNKEKLVSISPNPTSGMVSLDWNSNDIELKTLKVYNEIGLEISNHNIEQSNNCQLDLQHYPKGIYSVCLQSEADIVCKRLILCH